MKNNPNITSKDLRNNLEVIGVKTTRRTITCALQNVGLHNNFFQTF